jgi:hypothetical protein
MNDDSMAGNIVAVSGPERTTAHATSHVNVAAPVLCTLIQSYNEAWAAYDHGRHQCNLLISYSVTGRP